MGPDTLRYRDHSTDFIGSREIVKKVPDFGHLIYLSERMMGIGPTFKAWEALVLPLNYIR